MNVFALKHLSFVILSGLLWMMYIPTAPALTQNEIQKLLASDAATGDGFGYSVSVDGDTVVIGARGDDDNCPADYNPLQEDTDNDLLGDVCDTDDDDDTILDDVDNCPLIINADQADVDNDGIGDVCDPQNDTDTDGDSVIDLFDNCPFDPNPYKDDFDGDGIGNICDGDEDGDGVTNALDFCPITDIPESIPTSGNLKKNRYALTGQRENDAVLDFTSSNKTVVTTADTEGVPASRLLKNWD